MVRKSPAYVQKIFASEMKRTGIKYIPVNIWDDYYDESDLPKGKKQETHAYVESEVLSNSLKDDVLHFLKEKIESLHLPGVTLRVEARIYEEDGMVTYDPTLYLTNLTHPQREALVRTLEKSKLTYEGAKFDVYSES